MKNLMDQMGTRINHNKNNGSVIKDCSLKANGLCQHAQEIKFFIQIFNRDILILSETHFTNRSYITIPNYNTYDTNHPDKTVHGSAAVIIRQAVKHYVRAEYIH
jgi:hypothetical protein